MWGTENVWLVTFDIAAVAIAAVLYMLGGTEGFAGKWLRRFLATFILSIAINVTALVIGKWAWQLLLTFPSLIGGMSLGYGAERLMTKVFKRSIFALGVIFASMFCMWALGWPLVGIGIIICQLLLGACSVYLGVKNPYNNAPAEQALICLLLTIFLPFWPFVA